MYLKIVATIVQPTGSSAMALPLPLSQGSLDFCFDPQSVEEVTACNFWGWSLREWQLCFYCLECRCHVMKAAREEKTTWRRRGPCLLAMPIRCQMCEWSHSDVPPPIADNNNPMRCPSWGHTENCPAEPCLNSWIIELWANILLAMVLSH